MGKITYFLGPVMLSLCMLLSACGVVIEDFPEASSPPPALINGEWAVTSSMGNGTVNLKDENGLLKMSMRSQDGEMLETVGRYYELKRAHYLVIKDASGPKARLALLAIDTIDAQSIRLISLNTQEIRNIMTGAHRDIAVEARGVMNQIVLSKQDLEFLLDEHAEQIFSGGEGIVLTRVALATGA